MIYVLKQNLPIEQLKENEIQTMLVTDVAVKSVDGSQSSRELEDLQKGRADRTWHRFGAGLGGSDAFVSQS